MNIQKKFFKRHSSYTFDHVLLSLTNTCALVHRNINQLSHSLTHVNNIFKHFSNTRLCGHSHGHICTRTVTDTDDTSYS